MYLIHVPKYMHTCTCRITDGGPLATRAVKVSCLEVCQVLQVGCWIRQGLTARLQARDGRVAVRRVAGGRIYGLRGMRWGGAREAQSSWRCCNGPSLSPTPPYQTRPLQPAGPEQLEWGRKSAGRWPVALPGSAPPPPPPPPEPHR